MGFPSATGQWLFSLVYTPHQVTNRELSAETRQAFFNG